MSYRELLGKEFDLEDLPFIYSGTTSGSRSHCTTEKLNQEIVIAIGVALHQILSDQEQVSSHWAQKSREQNFR